MPPPLPLTDNNADVRLRENDPKYGDDSREAITSRFYQTVTVSDVRMADSEWPFSQPKLALQLLLSLVVEAMTKIHLKDPAKFIQRIIDTCKSL